MKISFRVPAIPIAQPRARATMGRGGHARIHEVTSIKSVTGERKPHPIAAFKATVKHAAFKAYQGAPLQGSIRVKITAVFPRPSGMMWKKKPMPRVPHVSKPDVDNLAKSCLDCLNMVLWRDDAQISRCEIVKVIASGDEQPHVSIEVSYGENDGPS